jgi:putative FmdB family regulatory protein
LKVFQPSKQSNTSMPIYAYKCDSCGFAKDVLQKISDQPLVQCPSCQAEAFKKQVTAAGFQLKGSGWYATDFKGGNKPAAPAGDESKSGAAAPAPSAATPSDSGGKAKSDSASATPAVTKKTESTPSTGSGS